MKATKGIRKITPSKHQITGVTKKGGRSQKANNSHNFDYLSTKIHGNTTLYMRNNFIKFQPDIFTDYEEIFILLEEIKFEICQQNTA